MLSMFEDKIICLIIGSALIVPSFFIKEGSKSEFLEHLALAINLTGQVLIYFGLGIITDSIPVTCLIFGIVQLSLAYFLYPFLQKILLSFFGLCSISYWLISVNSLWILSSISLLLVVWFWQNEFKDKNKIHERQAFGYGAIIYLVFVKGVMMSGKFFFFNSDYTDPLFAVSGLFYLDEVFYSFISFYLVYQIVNPFRIDMERRTFLCIAVASAVICLISVHVQGLLIAVCILLLGFSSSNRLLMAVGIASLLYFISSYYYFLDQTLLLKSVILILFGFIGLLIRWFFFSACAGRRSLKYD